MFMTNKKLASHSPSLFLADKQHLDVYSEYDGANNTSNLRLNPITKFNQFVSCIIF